MTPSPLQSGSPFAQSWQALVANGYSVLPISPMSKAPSEYVRGRWHPMSNWQQFRSAPASDLTCKLWATWPQCNVGILTGTHITETHVLACVDFDSDSPEILDALDSILPRTYVTKKGRRGYSAFYLVPNGTKGFRTPIVELLTDTRQTVIPPSIHPDTGQPYRWTGPETLLTTRAIDLPELDEDDLKRFTDVLATLIPKPVQTTKAELIQFPAGEETIWRRLNNTAYANLDRWVPDLGLPKLRKTQGGYQAVANWRASTTGRPISQRNPNLSILTNAGARDFGDGRAYTAIDLVKDALSLDLDHAFQWLGSRLGMIEEPVTLTVNPPHDPDTGEIIDEPAKDDELPDALTNVPGLLGDVTDWIMATSRKPNRTLALGAAATVIGTLIGQSVGGPTEAATHLYVIGLAPSGAGKDHPLKAIGTLLRAANAGDLIGPSSFASMQAVTTFLKRKSLAVCAMDEFGAYVRRINAVKASEHERGISQILRSLWSANFEPIQTPERASAPSVEIHNPALSIYGVSTPKEFFDALDGDAVSNGFLNRFLLMPSEKNVTERDPRYSARDVPEELATALARLRLRAASVSHSDFKPHTIPQRRIKFLGWGTGKTTHDALLAKVQKLRDIDGKENFYARTVEMALRLATIMVYADGRELVDAADMEWAGALSLWSSERLETMSANFIADNETQRLHNKVVRIVTAKGGKCSHRELLRALKGSIRSQDLKGVMENLLASGQFEAKRSIPPGGGPPTISYELQK